MEAPVQSTVKMNAQEFDAVRCIVSLASFSYRLFELNKFFCRDNRTVCMAISEPVIVGPLTKIDVSSAYKHLSLSTLTGKSFTNTMNNMGPSMDTCRPLCP